MKKIIVALSIVSCLSSIAAYAGDDKAKEKKSCGASEKKSCCSKANKDKACEKKTTETKSEVKPL